MMSMRLGNLVIKTAATTVCLLLLASTALATDTDMAQLPLANPFFCATCHVSESPTSGSFALNAFGQDFLENGRIWDSELASGDSDGDGCTNGVEVGDADGDGWPDGNVQEQESNPGLESDCGSGEVDEIKWSQLKAMFTERKF